MLEGNYWQLLCIKASNVCSVSLPTPLDVVLRSVPSSTYFKNFFCVWFRCTLSLGLQTTWRTQILSTYFLCSSVFSLALSFHPGSCSLCLRVMIRFWKDTVPILRKENVRPLIHTMTNNVPRKLLTRLTRVSSGSGGVQVSFCRMKGSSTVQTESSHISESTPQRNQTAASQDAHITLPLTVCP